MNQDDWLAIILVAAIIFISIIIALYVTGYIVNPDGVIPFR